MKQLNLLKNRGKRRGLPLMSVSRFFMVVIMLFATLQINAEKKEKVMYMIIENNVATFYYDELCNDKFEAGMHVVPIYDGPYRGELDYASYIYMHYGDSISNDGLIRIIRNIKSNILRAVFTPSFSNARPTGTRSWFHGMTGLREIIGLEYLNTGNVTTMSLMFYGCSGLTSLDLSSFNTDNVTDMEYMFEGCSSLTSLDVSCFNTSNVTSMCRMFEGCKSLSRLNLSSFNTENVTNMVCMFYGCSSLTSLDLNNFNTGNVTSMSNMFSHCSGLTSLNVNKFNTSNVTSMAGMFSDCSSLTSLDVSCFNTSNVVNMGSDKWSSIDSHIIRDGGMFEGCSSLTSLDVSKFDTRNVTTMLEMFWGCKSLTNLDLSNFTTNNYTEIDGMLYGISSLESVSIGENMMQMPSFKSCEKIKRIVSYQKEPYVIAADCFTDAVKENAQLYVPNHSRTLYKNTDGWKDFKYIVSKDLDTKVEGDSEFKKDDIDENTDFNGNIFSNIFFNIPTESGEYDSAEGCIILKKLQWTNR